MFHADGVPPGMTHSQLGIIRKAPSIKPMYQSGCEPAVICVGLYGPYIQIGLICARPPISASTPKTTKKKPPALAV